MAELKKAVTLYQQLSQEWNKTPPQLVECGTLIEGLKLSLTELKFLPTTDSSVSKQELVLSRDFLEIAAQWALAKNDVSSFERYISQLKCYYFDFSEDLPESTYKFQLLGLNLLRLLAQNKLAEFHTELELLDSKDIQSNIYIKHPVSLEQYLMEGSYNKVFLARGNVPAESYNRFMDTLLKTLRDEIATCAEKAYDRLDIDEAARMLFFDSSKPLKIYASQRGWNSADRYIVFNHPNRDQLEPISTEQLAQQAIGYAKQLEMIV